MCWSYPSIALSVGWVSGSEDPTPQRRANLIVEAFCFVSATSWTLSLSPLSVLSWARGAPRSHPPPVTWLVLFLFLLSQFILPLFSFPWVPWIIPSMGRKGGLPPHPGRGVTPEENNGNPSFDFQSLGEKKKVCVWGEGVEPHEKKNREKWNSLIRISVQNRCRIEPGQNKQQMQSFVAKRLTHIFTARLFSLMK